MNALARFVRTVDTLNEWVGRGTAWLCLAMVLITFGVVVLRYAFSLGWVWLQESYVWLHGIVFMVGAGYTLLHGGHVRVDIFYRSKDARFKAWVDLFGSLLLLMPMIVVVFWAGADYIRDSWMRLEQSREAGGLHGLFLLKSVIWVFCVLLGLQGLSLAARSWLILRGHAEFVPPEEGHEVA